MTTAPARSAASSTASSRGFDVQLVVTLRKPAGCAAPANETPVALGLRGRIRLSPELVGVPAVPGTTNTGKVVFGTSVNATSMTVGGQATSFSSSQNVGWIGYLSDSANGTTITIILARETGGGAESVIVSSPMDVANPQDNEFSHTPDTVLSSEGVGTYTIRYVRPSDGKTLAEGTVTITP